MDIVGLLRWGFEFGARVWASIANRKRNKLQKRRLELEKESKSAQVNGDLNALRIARAEIEEIDRKLTTGDY